MSSNLSKKIFTGSDRSGAARQGTANRTKIKPPYEGKCKVEEYTYEEMLIDQASEMRAEINKLEEENMGMRAENNRLDKENTRLMDENRKLKEENTRLNAKHYKAEPVANSAIMDRDWFVVQLGCLTNENHKLKATIEENNTEILKLQKDLKDAIEQNMSSANESLKAGKQTTETKEAQLKRKNEEIVSLKKELETLKRNEAQLKSKSEEIESLRKELETLKNDNASLKAGKQTTEKNEEKLKNKEEEIASLKQKLETLQSDNASLKARKQTTEKEVEKHLKDIRSLKDASASTNKDLKSKYEQTYKELNDAKAEISELKNRLSQADGAKIMDNNPNITDLSDENRPTKLAEKYIELFDNEWTDAYEEVENELPNEQDIIKHLYQLLLDVFEFCQKSSEEYSKSLKSTALGLPSLTVENRRPKSGKIGVIHMRQLKELKKSFSPFLVEDVFQNYLKNRKLKLEKKVKTAEFIRKCVEICWLMSSQDPPVILDTGNVKGPFDSDRYRTYTKTGKTVDFVVWPPMLLHKDGPLLSKGVAQGK